MGKSTVKSIGDLLEEVVKLLSNSVSDGKFERLNDMIAKALEVPEGGAPYTYCKEFGFLKPVAIVGRFIERKEAIKKVCVEFEPRKWFYTNEEGRLCETYTYRILISIIDTNSDTHKICIPFYEKDDLILLLKNKDLVFKVLQEAVENIRKMDIKGRLQKFVALMKLAFR